MSKKGETPFRRGSGVMASAESVRKFLEGHPDLLRQWDTVRESLNAKQALDDFYESIVSMSTEYANAGLEFPADELLDADFFAKNCEDVVLQYYQLHIVQAVVDDMSTDVEAKLTEIITEDNFLTCLADSKEHLLDDLREILTGEMLGRIMGTNFSRFSMFPTRDGGMHAAGVMFGGPDGIRPAPDGLVEMLTALFGSGMMGYGGYPDDREDATRVIHFPGGIYTDDEE